MDTRQRKNYSINVLNCEKPHQQQQQHHQHELDVNKIDPCSLTSDTISDNNICCTCLIQTNTLRSIYKIGKICGQITKLSEMLTEIVGENYSENDGLPGTICNPCVLHISKAYAFRQQCKISHYKLKDKLTQEIFDLGSLDNNKEDNNKELIEIEIDTNKTLQCINNDNLKDITENLSSSYGTVKTENVSILNAKISDSPVTNTDDTIDTKSKTLNDENNDGAEYLDYNDVDQDDAAIREEEVEDKNVVILFKYDAKLKDSANNPTYTYELSNKVNDENVYESQLQQQQQQLDDTEETIEYYNVNETDKGDSMMADIQSDDGDSFNDEDADDNSVATDIPKIILPGYRARSKNAKSKPGVYECLECGKFLSNYHSHRYHLQLHSDATPFLCSQCGERFKTRNAYDGHMITHAEVNPHTCDICFKSYRQAASLRCHKLVHTGEKPFLCGLCGKGMTQKSGFKKHMMTHTGEKPFECEFCKKTFRYSGNLIMHQRTHTGEKPYVCEFCERGFTGCEQLKRHRLTHTGEKPFKCEICTKSFCRRSVLNAHLKVHNNSRNFSCKFCPSYFTKLSLLSTHITRAHKSQLHVKVDPMAENIVLNEGIVLNDDIVLDEEIILEDNEINDEEPEATFRGEEHEQDFEVVIYDTPFNVGERFNN